MKSAPPSEGMARRHISWKVLLRPAALAAMSGGLLLGFLVTPASAGTSSSASLTSGSGSYVPVTPTRIVDTRPGFGSPYAGQTIGSGDTLDVQVSGEGGIPQGAAVAVLNVTAINPTQAGWLSINPAGQSRPSSISNLNFAAGQTVANLVTVSLSSSGSIGIYNQLGMTDVAVDVEGYYGSSPASNGSGLFTAVSPPNRALGSSALGAPIGPNAAVSVPVAANNGVPADATAVVVNLTAAGGTAPSYLTAYATGATRPTVSNLNFVPHQTVANRATVALGTKSNIEVYNAAGTVDVDVDVSGYYSAAGGTGSAYVPITPQRLVDTRPPNPTGGAPIAPGATEAFTLANGSIPTSATAVATNITAIPGNAPGYLTVYPTPGTLPETSDVNWAANEIVPNFTIADTAGTGKVNIFNDPGSTINLAVDAFGYFALVPAPVMGLTISATPSSVAPLSKSSVVATVTRNGVPDGDVPVTIYLSSPITDPCRDNNDLNPSFGMTGSGGTFVSTYTAPPATGSASTCQVSANAPGGLTASTTITNLASG